MQSEPVGTAKAIEIQRFGTCRTIEIICRINEKKRG